VEEASVALAGGWLGAGDGDSPSGCADALGCGDAAAGIDGTGSPSPSEDAWTEEMEER
jgi:hypothetical protein